jgi:hypothetical protein
MNSVTNHHAGPKAGRFARCALRSALACALVLGASGAALAQQYGDRQSDRRDNPSVGSVRPAALPVGGRDPRYDVRAYEEQRRMQQQQQQQQEQREARRSSGSGRMTRTNAATCAARSTKPAWTCTGRAAERIIRFLVAI